MNLFHGLLFQGGHIADRELAMRLGCSEPRSDTLAPSPAPIPHRPGSRLRWLLEELILLGGRPVSKQHLDDLDEPFPTLHPCH